MKTKKLLILVVVAAVLVALATVNSRQRSAATAPSKLGEKVLPDLDLNAISAITYSTHDRTVAVERVDGRWVVPAKYGYPADFERIKAFAMKLRDLKIHYVANISDTQLENLQLLPPAEASAANRGATGTELRLTGGDGQPLAQLLVGRPIEKDTGGVEPFPGAGSYPTSQFVSTDKGAIYVVSDVLRKLDDHVNDWLHGSILGIQMSEIARVERTHEGASVVITKADGASDYALEDLAPTEQMIGWKANGLAGAIAYLSLADVADPALEDAALGFDAPTTWKGYTADGKIITVVIGGEAPQGAGRYIRVSASHEPVPADEADGSEDDASSDATSEVERINARVSGWTYIIEANSAEGLLTPRADMVEDKPLEDKAADDAATTAEAGMGVGE